MKYRVIGTDPAAKRTVSVLSLGAMLFGTVTEEATSFAILDRFVEAGGTFIDTSDNYAFWVNGTQGGESEELLGRWRRSRGIGDEVVIATKLGARPLVPAGNFSVPLEGLSAKVIRESADRSRKRTARWGCSGRATTGRGGWSGRGTWPPLPGFPAMRCCSTTIPTCGTGPISRNEVRPMGR
jgi:aryl-alcohol dehydrogenase-like predicted oxidoreductase